MRHDLAGLLGLLALLYLPLLAQADGDEHLLNSQFFHIPFDTYTSHNGIMRVISVFQDHRNTVSKPSLSSPKLRELLLFTSMSQKRSTVQFPLLQIHLLVKRQYLSNVTENDPNPKDLTKFLRVVQVRRRVAKANSKRINRMVIASATPPNLCVVDAPFGLVFRDKKGPTFLELIIRCRIPIATEDLITDVNSLQLRVAAFNDVVEFPLNRILHLGTPKKLIQTEEGRGLYPTAPWQANEAVSCKNKDNSTIRIAGASVKKFSWDEGDDVWLLWMLDVVRVDHIILNVVTSELNSSVIKNSIAQHPGLTERITLVEMDVPGQAVNVTYFNHEELSVWDLFVRWQADFDYILLADFDEYLHIFDNQVNTQRICISDFIEKNRDKIAKRGQVFIRRVLVDEEEYPNPQEVNSTAPLSREDLLTMLTSWLGPKGHHLDHRGRHQLKGKPIIPVNAALRPYLHFNQGYSRKKIPEHWEIEEIYFTHLRRGLQNQTLV